jgi:membrane protein required for colicin V production
MSFVDIILGLLLLYGLYKGLKNGLFVEIASIVALIAGIFGAIHFSYIVGDYLSEHMQWDDRFIKLTSFIITFIVIVVAVHFAGKLLTKIADFAMLGLVNKIAGALFGALKVAIILGAILIFFERVNTSVGVVKSDFMQNSILYEPVKEIGAFVFNAVLKGGEESEEE